MPLAKLRQLLEMGAYLQARREADRLLGDGGLSDGQQAQVLQMASRSSLAMREVYAATRLGERAIEQAGLAGDTETEGSAHFYVGRAYVLIGDPQAAEYHLESFLVLRPAGMERWEGVAHHDLASIYRQQQQWQRAIDHLDRALPLFEAWGQMAERAQATLDLAWCYMMLGASSLAEPHLAWVESYLSRESPPELTADMLCAKAYLARLKGDIATSCVLCQELFVTHRPGVTSRQIGEAAWVMGENALDLGRLEEAHLFAEWALDHATRANWPNLMNRILELKRRIRARTTEGSSTDEEI